MKAFKFSICIIAICAMLSSYFAPVHLKDLVIVEGIGIDEEDGASAVSVQLLNTNSVDASSNTAQGNSTVTILQRGDSVSSSLLLVQRVLSKDMYYGHNKLAVFSEECIKNGEISELSYVVESMKSRADIALCISRCDSYDILNSKENNARVPCENIVRLIKNNEKAGESVYVTAVQALDMYADKTSDLMLPVLDYSYSDETVYCCGIGIFDGNTLKAVLEEEDATGLLFLLGRAKNLTVEFDTREFGKISAELSGISTKNDIKIVDGDVIFDSSICFKVNALSLERAGLGSLSEKDEKIINACAEKYIEDIVQSAFNRCQYASSDCLNAGRLLSMRYPSYYEKQKEEWDFYFKNVKPSISAEAE